MMSGTNGCSCIRKIDTGLAVSLMLFFWVSICVNTPSAAAGQEDQKPLQNEVVVTLKLVEVYVLDKDKRPVPDLGKDDFQLFDNGKRMVISDFEKHVPGDRPAVAANRPGPKSESRSQQAESGRKTFLFFDFAFNNRFGLEKAKEAAKYFIDNLIQPDDRIGVLSYSKPQYLALMLEPVSDHSKAREVVEKIDTNIDSSRIKNIEEVYFGLRRDVQNRDGMEIGYERRFYKYYASKFFDRMNELAVVMQAIEGRKIIIYFSSGVASSIMYESPLSIYNEWDEDYYIQLFRKYYDKMIKNLGSANCSFFIMDTGELDTEQPQTKYLTGGKSLKNLGNETGGVYFDNPNNYQGIMDDIQNITSAYYVLGYYIDEAWDRKYHEIKVSVNRKGLDVYSPRGYFNPKPFSEYSKLERELHLMTLALSERPPHQEPVRLPLETRASKEKDSFVIEMKSRIPIEKIKTISQGTCEIIGMVIDMKDNPVKIEKREVDFSKYARSEFEYSSKFSVDQGKYRCRIIIRNPETGKAGVGATLVDLSEN